METSALSREMHFFLSALPFETVLFLILLPHIYFINFKIRFGHIAVLSDRREKM